MVWVDEKELKEMLVKIYSLYALVSFLTAFIGILVAILEFVIKLYVDVKLVFFSGIACGFGLMWAGEAINIVLKNGEIV